MDFRAYAAQPDEALDLLDGALLIARDAYPHLNLSLERQRIVELALPLVTQGVGGLSAPAQVVAMGAHLIGDCGFKGNQGNYYDPDNSYLNVVLDKRVGIPVSLAVLYIEVARHAGVRASGIGFPGHFLIRVEDDRVRVVVDPFTGKALSRTELERLLSSAVGKPSKVQPGMLDVASTRQILARMLMNLRGIYASRGEYSRLLLVLDRLVDLVPDGVELLRDRGFLWARLGAPRAAVYDLRAYARALPHADDIPEVQRAISSLEPDAQRSLN